LVSGLVDLALVVDLLNDVELNFHLGLLGTSTVAANLSLVFIIILRIGDIGVRKLNVRDLQVILRFTSGMCANQKTMGRIGLVWDSKEVLGQINNNDRLYSEHTLAYLAATVL
jgi:hypothetical protein